MYIITTKQYGFKDLMYLGWQEPDDEGDGYYWTYKDCIFELLNENSNTNEHPFLFDKKEDAEKLAKEIHLRDYNIEYFGVQKVIFIYKKNGGAINVEIKNLSKDITIDKLEELAVQKNAYACYSGCTTILEYK